jgi:hypothetical protein
MLEIVKSEKIQIEEVVKILLKNNPKISKNENKLKNKSLIKSLNNIVKRKKKYLETKEMYKKKKAHKKSL